jgi:hypothetical protein
LRNRYGVGLAGDYQRQFTIGGEGGFVFENRDNSTFEKATELPLTGDFLHTVEGRGRLTDRNDADFWAFEAQANDRFVLGVEVPGRPGATGLHYQVLKPDGSVLFQFNADYYGWAQTEPVVLTEAGRYGVRVTYNWEHYGEYRLRVYLAAPPKVIETEDNGSVNSATALSLEPNGDRRTAAAIGYIRQNGDLDYFKLGTLTNGTSIFLSARLPEGSQVRPVVS